MGATLLDKIVVEVDGRVDSAQRAFKSLGKDVAEFGEIVARVNGGAGEIGEGLGALGSRLGGLAHAFTSPAAGAGILGAAFAGLAVDALEMAEHVEGSLRRVSNALPHESPEGIAGLRESLIQLSAASGIAAGDLAQLYEAAAKDGAGSAEGVAALAHAAVQLREAYGGDLIEHAHGLNQVIRDFGLQSTDAEAVAATLYATAREVGVSLDELYPIFAKIAPAVQQNGVGFQEAAVKLAELKKEGTSTKQLATAFAEAAAKGDLLALTGPEIERKLGTLDARFEKLGSASDEARNATGALASELKNELGLVLVELGDRIGSLLNGPLKELRVALASGVTADALVAKRALDELAHPEHAPSVVGNLTAASAAAVLGQGGAAKGFLDRAIRNPERDLVDALATPDAAKALGATGGVTALQQAAAALQRIGGTEATEAAANVHAAIAALQGTGTPSLENPVLKSLGTQLRTLKQAVDDSGDNVPKLRQLKGALDALHDTASKSGADLTATGAAAAATAVDTAIDKAEQAADRQRATAERLAQKQLAARQSFDQATARLSPDQTDNLDSEIAHLVHAAQQAELGQHEIDAAVARLRAAAYAKTQADGDKLVEELRAQLVQGITSAARQAELALQEFDRKVAATQKKGVYFTNDQAAQIAAARAAKEQAVQIAQDSERLTQTLANRQDASANGEAPLVTLGKLQDLRDRELETLSGVNLLGQKINATDAQRVAAKQRLVQIDQQIAAAEGKQSAGAQVAKDNAIQVDTKTQQWANSLKNVANVAAGIVTIFQGANSELAHLLTSVAGVSDGISSLIEAGKKAGGLGNLFSSVSGLASAAGPIGAIISGGAGLVSAIGGLFGADPATKALQAAIEKNVEALHQNTTKLGTLDIGKTGQSTANAQTALTQLADLFDGQLRGLRGKAVSDRRSALLGSYGLTLGDIQALGKQFGIEVGALDNADSSSLIRQLLAALQSPTTQFGDFDQRTSISGATAAEKLQQYLQALTTTVDTQTEHTSAVAKAILGQFNLATSDGRKAAQDYIRQQYSVTKSISGDLAQQLLSLIDAAATEADQNASTTATGSATADGRTASQVASGAAQLDQATGLGLADLLRTSVTLEREHLDVSRQLLAAVRSVTPTGPITPPLLPGYGLPVPTAGPSAGAAAAGGVVVTLSIAQLTIYGSTADEIEASAAAAGRGIGRGIRDQLQDLDAALADATAHRLLAAGVLPGQSRPLGTPTAVGGGYVS